MSGIHTLVTLLLAAGLAGSATGIAAEPGAGPPPLSKGAPYVGVSYYPEIAGDAIDGDIRQMKEIGINLVRFGDFAWSRLEPNPPARSLSRPLAVRSRPTRKAIPFQAKRSHAFNYLECELPGNNCCS